MQEIDTVHIALEDLYKNTHIRGEWKNNDSKEYDGIIELAIDEHKIKLNAEVKKEVRAHQLMHLYQLANQKKPIIVVAERIFPKIKEELREHNIAYLEANGNIFLRRKGVLLWIDGNKPYQKKEKKDNRAYPRRAFSKTGLKVIFHFLLHEEWINKPYREIAKLTDVGLGNINYIFNGLKELGFLIKKDKNTYKLIRKEELLEKWMAAYEEKLKPSLKIGTFRFMKEEDFIHWKSLKILTENTCWGGEPAGDLLTHHLRPGELTLYTSESRTGLMKNYRLIPDHNGNVKVYRKFWYGEEVSETAPPLLVYVDLMNTNDKRCLETAVKVYDKFLKEYF